MSQLDQLIGYLEREGVTEVVLGVGRPIAMRNAKGLTNVTARPISAEQLASMLRGSPIAALIPDHDAAADPVDVRIGTRHVRVQIGRHGDEVVVRLLRPQPLENVGTRAKSPTGGPQTKAAPSPPRTKSATGVTRPKSSTSSLRAKSSTHAPRTDSLTSRTRGTTSGPRARSPMNAPRAKSPTGSLRGDISTSSRTRGTTNSPRTDASTSSRTHGTTNAPRTKRKTNANALEGLPTRGAPLASTGASLSTSTMSAASATNQPRSANAPFSGQPPELDDVTLQQAAAETRDVPIIKAADAAPVMEGFSLDLDTPALDFELEPQGQSHAAPSPAPMSVRMTAPSPSAVRIGAIAPARVPATSLARPTQVASDVASSSPAVPTHVASLSPAAPSHVASSQVPSATRAPVASVQFPAAYPAAPSVSDEPSRGAVASIPNTPRVMPVASGAFAALVRAARERRASDLHVSAGRVTSVRVGIDLVALDPAAQPLTAADAERLLGPLVDGILRGQLERAGYVDFALESPDGGRLRANVCRQQQGLKGTFRLALPAPLPLDALGLPAELAKVVAHHQGLVVIAGPSGHGKTTTLAALVDLVNSTKPHHILTIEDPIELVHVRKQAVISQREVGRDTVSFARGLKASLREDPDVIVIGELRDRESVEIALTAAETGHLVLATMSTPSAAKTIDRLVDMFPPDEQNQVRASIAGALRAIVAQRLLPRKGGGGVVPAIELVTGVLPLAVLIRDDKLYQLPNLMQRGRAFGMIRFDESLLELVRVGKIDEETALAYAESKKELVAQVQAKTGQIWKVPPR